MKLLLDERNIIVAIGSIIEYGVWGNVGEVASWRITKNSYMMDNNFTVVDIGDIEIPTYVHEGEYCYIDGKFKLRDECPNEYKDRIQELENNNAVLEEQLVNTEMTMIENYEAQEEINAQTENALIEIYEMMEG